jgi:MFS family permease
MFKKYFSIEGSATSVSDVITSSVILFNTFTWFYTIRVVINSNLQDPNNIIFFAIFDFTVIISGIIGALFAKKIKRTYIICFWLVLGVITSLLIAFLNVNLTENMALIAFLFGCSFGFGMPAGLAYFADCTIFENRGRSSGLLFAASNLGGFLLLVLLQENWSAVLVASSIWRTLGLGLLFLLKPKNIEREVEDQPSFQLILHNRTFILFFVPWLLFCLVDNLEKPYGFALAKVFGATEFIAFDEAFEPLLGTLFAFISGFVMDIIGRKKVITYGFISLGVAFAVLSIGPTIQAFWYVTSAIDGIAWGVFYVTFVLVLWGDLSSPNTIRERYFALGSIPFFLAEFLGKVIYPFAQGVPKENIYAAFPLASFFLFLAVLPLMYAPETLPEKKIKDRELKQYIDKAKKTKEKYT